MKKWTLPLLFGIAFSAASCSEDSPAPTPAPSLPPITQTGENTFGCYVNGELWLPKGNFQNPPLVCSYYNNFVQINADRVGQNPFTSIHLDFGKVFSDTTFTIHNYLDSAEYQYFLFYTSYYPSGPITSYFPLSLNSGELNLLKLDTVNRIMSGTFFFTAIDTATGDSVNIQDGRFDLRF
jgi:hypothetical protein